MKIIFNLICLVIFFSCGKGNTVTESNNLPQEEQVLEIEYLMDRNDVVWGFDFLPDGKIIFSERAGRILILDPSTRTEVVVTGVPPVSAGGEAGLLDLKLDPKFRTNRRVYFCYSVSGKSIALGRGVLNGSSLTEVKQIFKTVDANSSLIHFGCRIAFQNDSQLFLSIGDQAEPSKAQRIDSHLGKILRLNSDGSAPRNNPFVNTARALPEIWSLGHRNPQGLAIKKETRQLYASEHGPQGGDELNLISAGKNYGWPLVTRGLPRGSLGQSEPGYKNPLTSWSPSIAPSGMAFHRGYLYIATLRGRHIRRMKVNGSAVSRQRSLFGSEDLRFRNIMAGPDGLVYFSTDDGKIGRILEK